MQARKTAWCRFPGKLRAWFSNQGSSGVPGLTTGVYCAVGVTANVEERVGRGVGEYAGGCVGLVGEVLVGTIGLGPGVLVASGCGGWGVCVGDDFVGLGQEVGVGWSVVLGPWGGLVFTGSPEVAVGVRIYVAVTVCPGCSVGGFSPGGISPGVDVAGGSPTNRKVGVGVGSAGVTRAIPPDRPVSGGRAIPSKSWMISNPIAGTDTGISSTP